MVFLLFLFLFCDDVRGDSPGTPCVTERGRGGGEGRHGQVGECHAVIDVIWKNRGERVEVKSWKGSGDCQALLTSCSGTQMAEFLNSSFDEFLKKGQLRGLDWLPKSRTAEAPHQGVCVFGNLKTRGNRSRGLTPTGHGLMTGCYCCHYQGLRAFSDSHFPLYALQAPRDEGLFPRVSAAGPSIGCFLCAGLGLPSQAGSESEARGISVSLAFTLSLISTTVLIIYQMGIMTLQVNISFKEVWLIQKTLDSSVLCFT